MMVQAGNQGQAGSGRPHSKLPFLPSPRYRKALPKVLPHLASETLLLPVRAKEDAETQRGAEAGEGECGSLHGCD